MELVIVTGLSGAGKTVALNCLEDMGYYCIDNMPTALIGEFVTLLKESRKELSKAAICIDARTLPMNASFDSDIERIEGVEYRSIYLEASDETLVRRYSETRRVHPLSPDNVKKGIEKEKEILENVRKRSDYVIDTSNLKPSNLNELIRDIILQKKEKGTFMINVSSFGYKYGIPTEADIALDMRFIPNPYYILELKELTGNDADVSNYVLGSDVAENFLSRFMDLAEEIIPAYVHEGKYHLNIACGCTGGQHRSVAMANEIARQLRGKGYKVSLVHRDI